MKVVIPLGTFGRILLAVLVLGFVAGLVVSCNGPSPDASVADRISVTRVLPLVPTAELA